MSVTASRDMSTTVAGGFYPEWESIVERAELEPFVGYIWKTVDPSALFAADRGFEAGEREWHHPNGKSWILFVHGRAWFRRAWITCREDQVMLSPLVGEQEGAFSGSGDRFWAATAPILHHTLQVWLPFVALAVGVGDVAGGNVWVRKTCFLAGVEELECCFERWFRGLHFQKLSATNSGSLWENHLRNLGASRN